MGTSFSSDLQTVQKNALRIATRCMIIISIDHLAEETKITPGRTACRMPDHTNYAINENSTHRSVSGL